MSTSKAELCWNCGVEVSAELCENYANDMEKEVVNLLNTEVVGSFTGPYRFLSNFYPSDIWMDGYEYPTVEHAFQASKCYEPLWRSMIRNASSSSKAKSHGRKVRLREDWEEVKYNIMYSLVLQKFARHFDLRELLFDTGDAMLVEGNSWGDTYWGVCKGEGQNQLGKILMGTRRLLSDD